jgi:hypothetical protein
MRFSTPVEYETVAQALVKGACPFCTYLKNFQSKILRELQDPDQVAGLCNFHTWAMAAASNKAVVSAVFRKLLNNASCGECSICKAIAGEETTQMKEFAVQVTGSRVLEWIKAQGMFCIPHGTRFLAYVPASLQQMVLNVLKRNTIQLQEALEHMGSEKSEEKGQGGGVLGHAAEFLVSQRGL